MNAIQASQQRSPDDLAVGSASLRNLAVNGICLPDVLHDAADMLYDASRELEQLRKQTAAVPEMVTALQAVISDWERIAGNTNQNMPSIAQARAALAKAKAKE